MKLELTEKQLLRLCELEHFPSSRKIPPFMTEGYDFALLLELAEMGALTHNFVECALTSNGRLMLKYYLTQAMAEDISWRAVNEEELKHLFKEAFNAGMARAFSKLHDPVEEAWNASANKLIHEAISEARQVATNAFVVLPREAMDFYLKDSAPLSERALAIRDTFQTLVKL